MENVGVLLVFLWIVYLIARFTYRLLEKKIVFYMVFFVLLLFPFWDLIMANGMNIQGYTIDILAQQIVSDVNYVYNEVKILIGRFTE